jgi:uncharacterized protein YndB with AHSA1/START domain
MTALPHQLDRTVVIRATPETVFRFFTDDRRWASWWGKGSTIEAQPGGRVFIRYPGGVEVAGEVIDVQPPARLSFTYGFVSGAPIAAGTSRVTIRLEPITGGTRLHLTHEFDEPVVRDEHVQGWRYQLSLFANLVAGEVNADAATAVDRWFAMWAETSADARAETLAAIATPGVQFRDQYSQVDGAADLLPHIAAAQRHMPGLRLTRDGNARHCQGTVIADWIATGADGARVASGTNVFQCGEDGRFESAVGFWTR